MLVWLSLRRDPSDEAKLSRIDGHQSGTKEDGVDFRSYLEKTSRRLGTVNTVWR